jgi:hypothetical protein
MMSQLTEDATALAMLRAGYACDDPTDERRCLNFRVRLSPEAAIEAVTAIDSYNGFDKTRVIPAIEQIVAANPTARLNIGREGSPVIYVEGVFSDTQDAVMAILRDAAADEVGVTDGGYAVRAWWD